MGREHVVRAAHDWLADIQKRQRELDAERREAQRSLASLGLNGTEPKPPRQSVRLPDGWIRDRIMPLVRWAEDRAFTNAQVTEHFCPGNAKWASHLIKEAERRGIVQRVGGREGRGGKLLYKVTESMVERPMTGQEMTAAADRILGVHVGHGAEDRSRM